MTSPGRRATALELLLLVALLLGTEPVSAQAPDPYLLPTVDIQPDPSASGQLHPDIVAKADELQTPLRIFEFVHDSIEYEVYYGSKKGALGALWSRRANDFDQASLLIGLLRARNYRARYVIGVVPVPIDQAKNWAGMLDVTGTKDLFIAAYCWSLSLAPPAPLCAGSGPKRFDATGSTTIRIEHAWVEVEASAGYRGLQVGDSDPVWIPLDPSWKQKTYRPGVGDLPIDEEDAAGVCPSGKICFDYDGYYSKLDPRLPTEIWETQIRSWLGANRSGTAAEDVPYDGPIEKLGLEVLPLSLPFEPEAGFALAATADLALLSDGIPRRFRTKITVRNGSGTVLLDKAFDFPSIVPKRLTLTYEPTSASRPTVLSLGGYLGGPWQGASNLAEYCTTHLGNANCETTPVLKTDGAPCGTGCTTTQKIPLTSLSIVAVDRDLVPGLFAEVLQGGAAVGAYQLAPGTYASIGLDAGHTGDEQFEARIDRFLDLDDRYSLVDESEDGNANDDDNGNLVNGEVLLDRGSPGITSCTAAQYASPTAMETCDVAIAANFAHNDEFMGELLHLGTMRYYQRLRQEQRRQFAVDRVAGLLLPGVGVTTGGLRVDYFFDRALSVDASDPVIDLRAIGDLLDRIDAPTASIEREGRLLAHVGSALEHQVWEELTGREFISTVKGFQISRQRFPAHPVLTSPSPLTYAQHVSALNQLVFDRSGLNQNYISTLSGSGVRVTTPPSAVGSETGYVEVRIEETPAAGGMLIGMIIEESGRYGGALDLTFEPPSLLDLDLFPGDTNLWGQRFVTADPVSMVSGNNYVSEVDISIAANGPPLAFTRSYNSQSDRSGALGFGWVHAFEMEIGLPQDSQEFAYLPETLTGFNAATTVEGARSETRDSWNDGSGSLETVQFPALPTGFTQKATILARRLDIDYRGSGITFDVQQGGVTRFGPAPLPDVTGFGRESFDLPATVNVGSPWVVRFTNGFGSGDRLYFARANLEFTGAMVERIELPSTPTSSPGWASGAALVGDKDESTCAIPGSATNSVQSLTWPAPPDTEGAFAIEVSAAVRKPAAPSNERATLWLGPQTTGVRFLLGPPADWLGGARLRFFSTNLSQLTSATYEAFDTPHVELCELNRTLLRIRDQRELVLETGPRERFTKTGTSWVPAKGVRNQLVEIAGGYQVTRPDGSKLEFTQPGVNGSRKLTKVSDAQGRSLVLGYNATTQRLESVAEQGAPSRQLTFAYDVAGFIDTISDWSSPSRVWDYKVEQGDLVEFRDPEAVQNGWAGITYSYESGHVEDPALNHNLKRVTHPEDQNGGTAGGVRWVEFEYFNDDKVASHTDSLGQTQTFLFNLARLENQTTDPRGFTTIYRHDMSGNLIQRRDPDGAVWDWEYDEDRNVTSETDPLGRVRYFSNFDEKGNPGLVTDRDGKPIAITYHPLIGAPETIFDKRGNTRTTEFTSEHLPQYSYATIGGEAAPGTLLSSNVYDPTSLRVTQMTEPLGDGTGRVRDTRFFYEEPGDLTDRDLSRVESRDELGAVIAQVEYDYDLVGRPRFQRVQRETSASDPALIQLVTETVYNKRDQVERVVRPDGTVEVSEYDKNGNVKRRSLEETRPDGQLAIHNLTQFVYDDMDRAIESIDPAGGRTKYGYDLSGNRISMTDPENHTWRTEYDAMNRPVRVQDPNGAVTTTEYDVLGRTVATTDATGITTRRGYDAIGRLVEYKYGDRPAATRAVVYGQDSTGYISATAYHEVIEDPEDRVTKYDFDDLGRVLKVTDPASGVTWIGHNLLGSAQTVTDPIGKQTLFTFDALGRTRTVRPYYASAVETLAYDQTGNLIRRTKPDLCALEQSYDAMGRLVERRTANTSGSCANSPIDDQFGYDARGLLVAAQSTSAGMTSVGLIREYDALGRMLREIDTRFGSEVGYAYDPASRLTSKVYPDGSTVHYAYDGAGRTVGISDPFGETTRFVYDAAGRRVQKLGTSGLRTEYGYEPGTGWLTGVTSYTETNSVASAFTYPTHDDVGNRLEMNETNGGATAYTYDALDRLATLDPPPEAIYPANGEKTEFAYDAAGNRTDFGPKPGGSFVSPDHFTYTYQPTRKQLTAVKRDGVNLESFTYDANGNPATWTTGGAARALKHDALGRLVSITGGFSASYVYDPFGRRIEKTEAGTTTRYQYDGLDVVAEYSTTALQATYVFGPGMDEVLKLKRGTVVAAYHSDGLGSVAAISEGGTLRNTYRYDAFGKPIAQGGSSPLTNAYTYTGRELDGSGLYYYRARYYLPSAGRFLTPDPIGLAGGINAYTYVSSNPVNYTDPFGLMAGGAFGPAAPPSISPWAPSFGQTLSTRWALSDAPGDYLSFAPYQGDTLLFEIQRYAGVQSDLVQLGAIDDAYATGLIFEYAMELADPADALNAVSATLSDVAGRFGTDPGNWYLGYQAFGQSGFSNAYSETPPGNQVRHFTAHVLLGYYWGSGAAAQSFVAWREGGPSGPDYASGVAGLNLGVGLRSGTVTGSNVFDVIQDYLR